MKAFFLLPLVFVFFVSCKNNQFYGDSAGIDSDMNKVAEMVSELLPFIYDKQKFENPKNEDELLGRMRLLKKYIHQLPKEKIKGIVGADPIVQYAIENMESDMDGAIESYGAGHFKYSRGSLKSTVSGCFQCHTRTNVGKKNMFWHLNIGQLAIAPTEKADLFIATRQFEKAVKELESVFKKGYQPETSDPYLKEESLKKMLTTIVRVEQDPAYALKELERIEGLKTTPNYLSNSIQHWRQSLKRWLIEKSNPKKFKWDFPKYYQKAKETASEVGQDAAFVDYLRISSELHDQLGTATSNEDKASLYLRLGQTYEALKDSGFWDIPRVYFEACIVTLPDSSLAKSCYQLLKEEVTLGFTGSAGTIVPEVERLRLLEFKRKAGYR